MRRHPILRAVLVLVVICAFAALDATVKGHDGGTRNAVGNVSAPWALLPFLSSAVVMPRRPVLGALVGAGATAVALTCYSFVRKAGASAAGGGHAGAGPMVAAAAGNRWFLLGAVGGAALGAVGSWSAARRQWAVVAAMVAGVLVLEPAARIMWATAQGDAVRTYVPSPGVWAVEVLCGGAAAAAFWVGRGRIRRLWGDPPSGVDS